MNCKTENLLSEPFDRLVAGVSELLVKSAHYRTRFNFHWLERERQENIILTNKISPYNNYYRR